MSYVDLLEDNRILAEWARRRRIEVTFHGFTHATHGEAQTDTSPDTTVLMRHGMWSDRWLETSRARQSIHIRLGSGASLTEYFWTLAHEIGHCIDARISPAEYIGLFDTPAGRVLAEWRAWESAKVLAWKLCGRSMDPFDLEYQRRCLQTYHDCYNFPAVV